MELAVKINLYKDDVGRGQISGLPLTGSGARPISECLQHVHQVTVTQEAPPTSFSRKIFSVLSPLEVFWHF